MVFGARQQLGRYVAVRSPLHVLDSPVKLLLFLLLVASIFLSTTWLRLGFVSAYILVLCLASRVSLRFYIGNLKYFLWMFALSFAINVIFPRGSRAPAFSYEALSVAGIFSARLALMIVAATILTVVTCPSEIGDSVLVLARLKGGIGRRAAEFASLLSISLRFVPVMFEEAERIRSAQILRGHRASGLTQRVQFVIGLITPLIGSSMRRATNLGFALQARCYGYNVPRSAGLRLGRREIILGGSAVAVLLGLIISR
jgi:energy-coupling factor transport system permease protein